MKPIVLAGLLGAEAAKLPCSGTKMINQPVFFFVKPQNIELGR